MEYREKGIFVKDIINSAEISGVFYVKERRDLKTRNNDPYLALTLMDMTGDIGAKMWKNETEIFGNLFDEGDFIYINGKGNEYNGEIQVIISSLQRLSHNDVDMSLFMPATSLNPDNALNELNRFIESVNRQELRKLLETLFRDDEFVQKFIKAPAAKKMHHACLHGLLEHTLSVTRLADAVCEHYATLDRDLLVTGALCHDIGKVDEISCESPAFEYTDDGRLLGHITIGVIKIEKAVQKAGIDPDHCDIISIKHIVLSHHGELEFGSPVLPMTREALMLNILDNMDAKMNYMDSIKRKSRGNWTDYQRIYNRFFYMPPSRDNG
jgi:3'-5' exoribonuclease